MEQSLATDQATAPPSIFNLTPSLPFHFPTQQQQPPLPPAVQVVAPSLSTTAAGLPIPSFSFHPQPTMSQATFSSPSAVRFQPNPSLSPDPPGTTGPSLTASMPATSRLRAQVSVRAQVRRQQASAAAAYVAPSIRQQSRYSTRRAAAAPAAAAAAAVAPAAAASSSTTTDSVVQPRRSQRNRKRTTTREESTRDPPTKKQKRGNLKKAPPGNAKSDDGDTKSEGAEATASCCICMDTPSAADLASINGCEHLFCFDCIEKWAERENTCPLCKVRFTKIDRVNKAKRKKGESARNTKKVKQKDQRSDIAPGAALEGLLASFASSANFPPHRVARLIFSGMGGGNPFAAVLPGSSALRSSRAAGAAAAERANAVEDSLFSDDTDDDEDHSFLPAVPSGHAAAAVAAANPLADLFRTFPGTVGGRGIVIGSALGGRGGLSLTTFDPPPGRSYATNSGDRNAGRQAENPLEIEDDSEDEEDIEVVQVTRRL